MLLAVSGVALTASPASAVEPTVFTAEGPSSVQPTETITFIGRATAGGAPLPGHGVTVERHCPQQDFETFRVTTAADGTWAFSERAPACLQATYRFYFNGALDGSSTDAYAEQTVAINWKVSSLDITLSDYAIDPGQTVTISGTFKVDGIPTGGAAIRVSSDLGDDGNDLTRTVTSAADGSWTVDYTPSLKAGYPAIQASWPGDAHTLPSQTQAYLRIDASIARIFPDLNRTSVTQDDTVTFAGTLRDIETNQGLTDRRLRIQRWLPDGTTESLLSTVTDAEGRFTFTDGPLPPGETRYEVIFDGDDVYTDTTSTTLYVSVSYRSPTLVLTAPESVTAGEVIPVRGLLLREDGSPFVGVPVQIRAGSTWSYPEESRVSTDVDGTFGMDVPTRWKEVFTFSATSTRDAEYVGGTASARTLVVGRTGVMRLTTPQNPVAYGTGVVMNALVQDLDGVPDPGGEVDLYRENPDGTREKVATSSTSSAGSSTFRDNPEPGTYSYVAVHEEGRITQGAVGRIDGIVVTPGPGALTASARDAAVGIGDPVTLDGAVTTASGSPAPTAVTITRVNPDGSRSAPVAVATDDQGAFTYTNTPRAGRTTYELVTEPGRTVALRRTISVTAGILGLTTKPTGGSHWSDGYRVYTGTYGARVVGTMSERLDGACMGFQIQRRRDGVWRTTRTISCLRTQAGVAAVSVTRGPDGSRWRARATYGGSTRWLATRGNWAYILYR